MANETVEKSSNLLIALIVFSVLGAVSLLSVVIVINSLGSSYDNYAGNVTQTVVVTNETGFANSTGYTLSYTSIARTSDPTITRLFNRTSNTLIGLGNVSVSASGLVTNATSVVWNNLSISYTYVLDTTNSTTTNIGLYDIRDNVVNMVANFFELAPTIGTILAVVVLIAGIVILVFYVRRMKGSGENRGEVFAG